MEFTCAKCRKTYEGIPSFGSDEPAQYWEVPEDKRDEDVILTLDSCVIAGRFFFIHGCLEIPIVGTDEEFVWGVWISLKEENFFLWQDCYEEQKRCTVGPFFGWLCTIVPGYPDTLNLKTMAHLRDDGFRPSIELEHTDHQLAIDQREGISLQRVQEIVQLIEHGENGEAQASTTIQ
jgi:hypothetical protein